MGEFYLSYSTFLKVCPWKCGLWTKAFKFWFQTVYLAGDSSWKLGSDMGGAVNINAGTKKMTPLTPP
jgi:hypothetical protein